MKRKRFSVEQIVAAVEFVTDPTMSGKIIYDLAYDSFPNDPDDPRLSSSALRRTVRRA